MQFDSSTVCNPNFGRNKNKRKERSAPSGVEIPEVPPALASLFDLSRPLSVPFSSGNIVSGCETTRERLRKEPWFETSASVSSMLYSIRELFWYQ